MLKRLAFGGLGLFLLATPLLAGADAARNAAELSRWETIASCFKGKIESRDYATALSCLGSATTANTLFTSSGNALRTGALAAAATPYAQGSGSNSTESSATEKEEEAEMLTDLLSFKIAPEPISRQKTSGQFASDSGPEKVKQQVQVAKRRGQLMKQLAEEDPDAFLRNVIPESQRSKFSNEVKNEIEQKVTLSGKVEVFHMDSFTNPENSEFKYTLQSGGSRISLKVSGNPPAMTSGASVRVNGYQLGETIVANGDSSGISVISQPPPEAVGEQNMLVILITSSALPSMPTKEAVRDRIFSGDFARYFEEQSYGNTRFSGDVTDWITIPAYPSVPDCGFVQLNQSEVRDYITSNGISLTDYSRIMFVVNTPQYFQDSIVGCARIGKNDVLFNGTFYRLSIGTTGLSASAWSSYATKGSNMRGFDHIISHEMGHELGVNHANSWECSGPLLDTNCAHVEYGNFYDVMGRGEYAEHFNAYYKDLLGWLDNSSKVFITQSGRYSLAPLEAQAGVRAGIVTNPATPSVPPLYIEFRQPIGYDGKLSPLSAGLQLNQVVTRGPYPHLPFPWLINANYVNAQSKPQESLMPGSNFSWASRGISIGSLVTTPTLATFDVGITQLRCDMVGLSVSDVANQERVAAGSLGGLGFKLTNDDSLSCSPRTIELSTSITNSSGWLIQQVPSARFSVNPNETQRVFITFSPSFDAIPGNRTIRVTVSDLTNGRSYNVERSFTIPERPMINEVAPSSGGAGTVVTLKGTGFNESPESNSLYFNKGNLTAAIRNVSARAGIITFIFPTMFDSYGEGNEAPSRVPTQLGEYTITLIRDNDNGGAGATFTVTSGPALSFAPTINSITPSRITTVQPTSFTVIGTNFNSESRVYYSYSGTDNIPPGSFRPTFNSSLPNQLTFSTASLPKGTYTLLVKNGELSSNPMTVTVDDAGTDHATDPVISSFTPESVAAGRGTNIEVRGHNFQSGAVLVYSFGNNNTGELPTTFTPAPIPGQEQILTTGRYAIEAVGGYTFYVKNPNGQRSEDRIFTVTPTPPGTSGQGSTRTTAIASTRPTSAAATTLESAQTAVGETVTVDWNTKPNVASCRIEYKMGNKGEWTTWTTGGGSGSVSAQLTAGTWYARAICDGTTSNTVDYTVALSSPTRARN